MRHQLAILLAQNGHKVFFVEKPRILGFTRNLWARNPSSRCSGHTNIILLSSYELLHHQLRVIPFLHLLNSLFYNHSVCSGLRQLPTSLPIDHIVNFNYDSYRFRQILSPLSRNITIINDDFEAHCKLPVHNHITWVLKNTCKSSDIVLAPSNFLRKRLSEFNDTRLFAPWSFASYTCLDRCHSRTHLLYWGYIDDRLDYDFITDSVRVLEKLGFCLDFIGPVKPSAQCYIRRLSSFSNFTYYSECSLDQINSIKYQAAFLPYNIFSKGLQATFLPNKILQLFSIGLPAIMPDWNELVSHDAIIRYKHRDISSFVNAVHTACRSFVALQPSMEQFVSDNSPRARYQQFLEYLVA